MNKPDENKDKLAMGGFVTIELIRMGKEGPEVVHKETVHNLIINTGKRQTWRQAMGLNTKAWNFMRIGTSSQAAASAQTNLTSPVSSTLKTCDSKTLLSGTRTAQWVISYPSGGGTITAVGIKEVSLFNQHTSPGGSALMRTVFSSVSKTTADKLKITYSARIT